MSQPSPVSSERLVIALISAVQFINILEFMMVMPLGPDFAKALGIPMSSLGLVGGSYTASASIAGIVASTFVERLDRRVALAGAMAGLILATVAAGFATGLSTLLAARVLAGLFGGPASALSLAIIADVVPPERRGKAMGTVMGSFALASVLGVPIGLELARVGGWRLPFFCVGALGVVVVAAAIVKLPPLRAHLTQERRDQVGPRLGEMLRRPVVLMSLALGAFTTMSPFLLIPNLAAYVQGNLHFPRDSMSLLYLVGGSASFITMRFVGRFTDSYGSFAVGTVGTVLLVTCVYFGFVDYPEGLPVMAIFVAFMVAASIRNVPYNALISLVPKPNERARFMSIQSSVQHISAAAGALLSSQILVERADHGLDNIDIAALLSIALAVTMPFFMRVIQAQVRVKSPAAHAATPV